MNKKEFLDELAYRLSYMDKTEKDDIINYYNELIEDGIETGKTDLKYTNILQIAKAFNITPSALLDFNL